LYWLRTKYLIPVVGILHPASLTTSGAVEALLVYELANAFDMSLSNIVFW
jgi:hypothetical protein